LTAKINAFVGDEEPPEWWLDIPRTNGGLTPSFAR
jgi:hypothetical protein